MTSESPTPTFTPEARAARVARRAAALHAGDAQFRDAASRADVDAAIRHPGLRLAQIVDMLMEAYAHRPAHSALPVLDAFRRPSAPVPGSLLLADDFHAAVRALGIGPDGDIPHLSAALVRKYVADLRQLGLA